MPKMKPKVRPLCSDDLGNLVALEEAVWGPKGIECVTREVAERWAEWGLLLGAFERDRLRGYAYAELVSLAPIPPYSSEILSTLRDYKASRLDPQGNALHGISMATDKAGAGEVLLRTLTGSAGLRLEVLRLPSAP